jgi:ABC-type transport system involved in multi-copper enzyme maturation permease subunit
MTTNTTTPYRSETRSVRDGFAQLLRAEWTKFRTVRGWVIGVVVAALVTVLVGILAAAGSNFSCSGPNGQTCSSHSPALGPGGEAVNDSFFLVHQPLAGDGSITVRVTSLTGRYLDAPGQPAGNPDVPAGSGLQPWSKAGIILKESTTQGSAYAALMVTGANGVRMQHNYTGDTAGLHGGVSPASPRWLRLTRSGDTIAGYESVDGTNWSVVSTVNLAGLPSTVEAGLFATSPGYTVTTESFGSAVGSGGGTLATALFDHADLQGTKPRGTWTGDDIGGQGGGSGPAGGTGPVTGFQQSGDSFTVSGTGDIAPVVAGRGSLSKTIESGLVGAFAGLIAIIVVATTFLTSEYRRGLIRTTLAASPRRGRVLVAKAFVIGSVAFITGLVAAAIAVPIVEKLERDKGLYVFPVSALTELRVVAGTGALLAVAAILALAVSTVLRRGAGAVTVVVVATVLPYVFAVASVLPSGASQWLLRLTPAAGFAILQSMPEYPQVAAAYTPADGYFPLGPWGGFAVLCAYAALALVLATFVLRRRDV